MYIIVTCLLTEKKSLSINLIIKISTFIGFGTIYSREVFLGGNMYNFPVDYNAIDKSDYGLLNNTAGYVA